MTARKPLESVRRAFRIVWILQGHTFDGLRLQQVAEALRCTPSTAYRDLETMAEEGVAERIPGREDSWRLTPKLIQLSRAHDADMTRTRRRIDDIDNRYTRLPK